MHHVLRAIDLLTTIPVLLHCLLQGFALTMLLLDKNPGLHFYSSVIVCLLLGFHFLLVGCSIICAVQPPFIW